MCDSSFCHNDDNRRNINSFNNIPNNILQTENNPKDFVKSVEGKLFTGLSDNLHFGQTQSAWAGLINPKCSCVNCFLDEFTVSNLSSTPCVAKLFFNALPATFVCVSTQVSPGDTSLCPNPCPRVKLVSAERVSSNNLNGVNVLELVIPPLSSISKEIGGKFVCPSCGSFIIQLEPLDMLSDLNCTVSFVWWEERFIIHC